MSNYEKKSLMVLVMGQRYGQEIFGSRKMVALDELPLTERFACEYVKMDMEENAITPQKAIFIWMVA